MNNWLNRLAPSTAKVNGWIFNQFLQWLKQNGGEFADSTPDDLVKYQEDATNSHRYKILELIQTFISQHEGRAGYKEKMLSTMKSFFAHNRAELPRDPTYRIRSEKQRVIGTLTPKEVQKIVLGSKPAYQAIILSMLQGGMGVAEFEFWNLNGYDNLVRQLKDKPRILRVDLPGRKAARNIRPYYTFIGGDAIDAIENWLAIRPDNDKDGEPVTAIFTNQYGKPIIKNSIQLYWLRHIRKIGLTGPRVRNGDVGHRTGKNIHELRDVFRSLWEKSAGKGTVAEYLMGHQVDPLEYNKAFRDDSWTIGEYSKALPMLQIMSSGRPFGKVDESEIDTLRHENEALKRQLESVISEHEAEGQKWDQRFKEYDKKLERIGNLIERTGARD